MKKKFLSVIAIFAILLSVAAPYCSAIGSDSSSWDELGSSDSSSWDDSGSSSSVPGSPIINESQILADLNHIMSSFEKKKAECDDLKNQIASLKGQNLELEVEKNELDLQNKLLGFQNHKLSFQNHKLGFQNNDLNLQNQRLDVQVRKLQKKHPFIRFIKIAGVIYIVYDVYNKNSSEDNFNFVKTFAKESADQLKSNVLCEDSANKILCVAGQKAASLAGYVKGFSSAELCVLTNGSLCPDTVKVSAQEYLAGDQIKTLSFIK